MRGGDEGVEVGIGLSDAWCRLVIAASSLARFASIACLWAESVGAAELEASRSFPDAVSKRLGRAFAIVVAGIVQFLAFNSLSIFISDCG